MSFLFFFLSTFCSYNLRVCYIFMNEHALLRLLFTCKNIPMFVLINVLFPAFGAQWGWNCSSLLKNKLPNGAEFTKVVAQLNKVKTVSYGARSCMSCRPMGLKYRWLSNVQWGRSLEQWFPMGTDVSKSCSPMGLLAPWWLSNGAGVS